MYELRVYDAGKMIRAKQFADYKEAMKAAATAERRGEGVTEIKYVEKK